MEGSHVLAVNKLLRLGGGGDVLRSQFPRLGEHLGLSLISQIISDLSSCSKVGCHYPQDTCNNQDTCNLILNLVSFSRSLSKVFQL